jgi:predicted RNA methylase
MRKLTREERQLHDRAEDLLWGSDKPLTHDEVQYVYQNWLPYASHAVEVSAAFFTPLDMARVVAIYAPQSGRVLDLAAGIGVLSYAMMSRQNYGGAPVMGAYKEIVAVEVNEGYIRVGKRLLPDVTWVQGNALEMSLWLELGRFDGAVSNPPFGRVLGNSTIDTRWLSYRGANDLMFAEIALRVAPAVTMILPTMSVPFEYQTRDGYFSHRERGEWTKFQKALPGAVCNPSSWPTAEWDDQWRGAKPATEIVTLELDGFGEPLGVMSSTNGTVAQLSFI